MYIDATCAQVYVALSASMDVGRRAIGQVDGQVDG